MKKIKVYFMGKPLREIYPHASKWEVFKYKVGRSLAKITKVTAVALFIAGVAFGSFKAGLGNSPSMTYARGEIVDTLTPKVEQLKEELLDTLKKCESSLATEDDAVIRPDDGGSPSFGLYQFKITTVQYYAEKLNGEKLTNYQALNIAMSGKLSRELAQDIMFKSTNKANDWHTCQVKHGLNAKIDLIKQLEK